jgi:hypothetical protein
MDNVRNCESYAFSILSYPNAKYLYLNNMNKLLRISLGSETINIQFIYWCAEL